MPLSNFTYHYRLPPSATLTDLTVTYPDGGDLLYDVDKDGFAYRLLLTSEFTAIGVDYAALEALRAADACDDVEFVLKLDGTEVWSGQLNMRKARWFPDTCSVKFKPDVEDDYNCLYENWETEKNVLESGSLRTAETLFGTLDEQTCQFDDAAPVVEESYAVANVSGCLDDVTTYIIKQFTIEDRGLGVPAGERFRHTVTWVSERVITTCSGGVPVAPPGNDWTLVLDDCVGTNTATYGRPPARIFDGEYSAVSGLLWDNRHIIVAEQQADYNQGVLLEDILQDFADDCSLTVKSDFFNINPPGTAPSNAAYTAAAAVQAIIVYQKSDIKRPNASNAATLASLRLKDMLEILANMFQVYWQIENSGADFRIEHISFFDGGNGDDLTVDQPGAVAGFNAFTYDIDKLAPQDEFTWMDNTDDEDFRGLPIVYPSSCADPLQEPRQINLNQVFTDLGTVVNDTDNVSDNGLFFMATDLFSGTYYINRENGELSGEPKLNGHLSWANLHENYHTWGRPLPSGTLNGTPQTFDSYNRSKRQEAVTANYDHTEFFALDFTDKIKSELGWGEIAKAGYSARGCALTIELLHDD